MITHHIGIACKDIYKTLYGIKQLHFIKKESKIIWDEDRRVSLCLIEIENGERIELVSGDLVSELDGIYHICYLVGNLSRSIKDMVEKGAIVVQEPAPAILFNNRRVAFLAVVYGIIELLEC